MKSIKRLNSVRLSNSFDRFLLLTIQKVELYSTISSKLSPLYRKQVGDKPSIWHEIEWQELLIFNVLIAGKKSSVGLLKEES